ncbi:MAG: SRPBCC family protein [Bacteroidia bacterium]|nr:SRPBCC family protein [Bacteroidia bacterium]
MEENNKVIITVQTTINAPIEKVWKCWTSPEDIVIWNTASEDWHSPHAENDLRVGGNFNYRMESKDRSMGFDFFGVYNKVITHKLIEYTLGDGRKATVIFKETNNKVEVIEDFEAENENSYELQKIGWQTILNNFRKHTETK